MKLGIIGGSGLYEMPELEILDKLKVDTPFGHPSDFFIHGKINGNELYFLPRHGVGHRIMPTELNHRANIFAMKLLGVNNILSISAVGSLREDMKPRDVVIVDQFFDRTKDSSQHSFFGNGVVAHISFGDPVCSRLAKTVHQAALEAIEDSRDTSRTVHASGTYVNMSGPAFSTRAESNFYRSCGFDVIGMTNLPEAKLAREAEICYASCAMVTDFDCWHESHDSVNVEMLIGHLKANSMLARNIIKMVSSLLQSANDCKCRSALATALITQPDAMVPETREKLMPIIGKYVK